LFFDNFLIIPGGFGCLITGIWIAVRTNWGFAKYYWIIAKWIGNIVAILLGSAIIGLRIHNSIPKILSLDLYPLQNQAYLNNRIIVICRHYYLSRHFTFLGWNFVPEAVGKKDNSLDCGVVFNPLKSQTALAGPSRNGLEFDEYDTVSTVLSPKDYLKISYFFCLVSVVENVLTIF
jgi:hypothetical protein